MTKFKIQKEEFKTFLKICSMEGSIQFRDNKAIKKPMFSAFTIVAGEDNIKVLATDTHRKKTDALFIKKDVEVIEAGEIPITSYGMISKILKGKGISGEITVSNKNDILILDSEKDVYEIRQKKSEDLEKLSKDTGIKKHLTEWLEWHKFDGEQGTLIMHHVSKTGKKTPVPYPTRIKVNKKDLLKVVGDTLDITKDNKTRLILKDGIFRATKGEANASISSKHTIEFTDEGLELVEFEEDFYSIQTIIPNLFDEIYLNIRRVKANKTITIYVTSYDEKSKIEVRLGLVSIIVGNLEES